LDLLFGRAGTIEELLVRDLYCEKRRVEAVGDDKGEEEASSGRENSKSILLVAELARKLCSRRPLGSTLILANCCKIKS